jgi:hypothetical protein
MPSTPLAGLATGALALTLLAGCGSTSPAATSASTPNHSASQTAIAPSKSPGSPTSSSPASPHATEFNPPGDIPDNSVYVDQVAPGSQVHFTVPEGWAKVTKGAVTTFTDKYNDISIQVVAMKHAPTLASVRALELPQLRRSVAKFSLTSVNQVTRQHGTAIHVVYGLDSAPNPVTNKVVRDVAERFDFWRSGQEAVLTLTGPQNADNVDPWQTVSDSLQWK